MAQQKRARGVHSKRKMYPDHYIVGVCPDCGVNVTMGDAKSYWAIAVGLKSKGLKRIRVQTTCCQNLLTLTQVKALRWGDKKASSEWGASLSAQRHTYGAGTGRPKKLKPCPYCGEQFGGREMREHKPRCPKRP